MHAFDARYTLTVATLCAVAMVGCRGSQPFSRSMVEVSQQPDPAQDEIDSPQQRLATANSRRDPDRRSERDDRPGRSSQTQASWRDGETATPDSDTRTARTRRRAGSPPDPPAEITLSDHRPPHPDRRSIDPREAEELMVAFKDYPPEVQREALRQLIAASARSAELSSHPQSPDTALADRLLDLPDLPRTAKPENTPAPTKLADRNAAATAVVSTGSLENAQSKTNSGGVQGTITDIATNDLKGNDSTDQSVSQAGTDEQVRPALATNVAGSDSIQQVSRDQVVDAVSQPNPAPAPAPMPMPTAGDLDLTGVSSDDLFSALLTQLSTESGDETEADRASRLIKLRHLMVLAGNPDEAVTEIDGMSSAEQEFLRHQLLGLWTIIDPNGHPVSRRRISSAMPQIRDAAKYAAAATDSLEVRSLAFCTEIEAYGQVTRFDNYRFRPGQQVILYCEVENFTAQPTADGFATHLQGSYDLYDENGDKVVSQLLPADEQLSANFLRDYFIAYQMYLPEQLQPGHYRLQLTMEDVQGKKYGQASVELDIKK